MDIRQTKARVKELLSNITVRENPDGDAYSHLEVEEWVELDTIKYELAREVDGIRFIEAQSAPEEIVYDFSVGSDLALATLTYHIARQSVYVGIDFAGDPTIGEGDGYSGDDNQAWMLFHALPVEEREDFIENVTDTISGLSEQVLMMIGNNPPDPAPNPALTLPRVTAWSPPSP
jgi:hypothetical protein